VQEGYGKDSYGKDSYDSYGEKEHKHHEKVRHRKGDLIAQRQHFSTREPPSASAPAWCHV
jgi:hypothetical protein